MQWPGFPLVIASLNLSVLMQRSLKAQIFKNTRKLEGMVLIFISGYVKFISGVTWQCFMLSVGQVSHLSV